MTAWFAQIGFGILVSLAGLSVLLLTKTAPNRLRLWVALGALSAIIIPAPFLIPAMDMTTNQAPIAAGILTEQIQRAAPTPIFEIMTYATGVILALSLLWILQTLLRSWLHLTELKERSQLAPELLALADNDIARSLTRTRVYRVKDSAVVATSGYFNPTVWIGDKIQEHTHLKCALNHEFRHIANGDQFALLGIVLLERLQWWNPITWKIGDYARDAMEHACDDWCANTFHLTTYRDALAALMLLKQKGSTEVTSTLQLNMSQNSKQIIRLEKLNMQKKLNLKHTIVVFISCIAVSISAIALAELPATRTLDSCHALLPEGSFELKINSIKNRDSGRISMSLVDHDDEEWTEPPERVMPFLECIRLVVGVGENEGWPSSEG